MILWDDCYLLSHYYSGEEEREQLLRSLVGRYPVWENSFRTLESKMAGLSTVPQVSRRRLPQCLAHIDRAIEDALVWVRAAKLETLWACKTECEFRGLKDYLLEWDIEQEEAT